MKDKRGITTVNSMFRVEDITCAPQRYQSEVGESFKKDFEPEESISGYPLHPITIESAIKFFADNAIGEKKILYQQTSDWLKKVLESESRRDIHED